MDFSACNRAPAIGERVTIIPNHVCVVSNLFNNIAGIRDYLVEVVWPVAARGMSRTNSLQKKKTQEFIMKTCAFVNVPIPEAGA